MTQFETFKTLHTHNEPFLLGNVWDAHSAQIFENMGLKAIGTSSAAIAASLGFEDGEDLSFSILRDTVRTILAKTDLPLTVDIEGGYSRDADQIGKNIKTLAKMGVVGVNIEDTYVSGSERQFLNAQDFAKTLKTIKAYLWDNDVDVFLNVRTDAYLLGHNTPLQESLKRIDLYKDADGIFVPGATDEEDIARFVGATNLPINVMTMPNLPDFKVLQNLGVKRISMGPFLYNYLAGHFENSVKTILKAQSFNTLFE